MKRCKLGSIKSGLILELHLHLLFDILSRLTIETIFSCKCVCKTFLEILTDPYFVQLHLTTAPSIDNGLIIQDRDNISNFLLVYKNRLEFPDKANCDSRPCQTLAMPSNASQFYKDIVSFVGSYNGLLCLRYSTKELCHIYYICNPILGEFLALPPPKQYTMKCEYSGFGFCPKTKQYKVFRFVTRTIGSIHTLGTDCWRQIGSAPFPRTIGSFDSSINGNLHWITESTNMSNLICCLNLETEHISYIFPPAHFNEFALKYMYLTIGLLGGLFSFNYHLGDKYEAFVMKDYGPEGRWTKMFSVDLSGFNFRGFIVKCLNNGDLVGKCDFYTLVYCNLRKRTIKHMLAEKNVSCFGVLSFVPSFVSLKDMAGASVGKVEVVQRKMGHNQWSEEGFRFIN